MNPKPAKLVKKKMRETVKKPVLMPSTTVNKIDSPSEAGVMKQDKAPKVSHPKPEPETKNAEVENEQPDDFQHTLFNLKKLTTVFGVIPKVHVTNEMVIDFIKEWQRGEREIIDLTLPLRLWTRVNIEEVAKGLEDIDARDECHLGIKRPGGKQHLMVTFYPMYRVTYVGILRFERVQGSRRDIRHDSHQYLYQNLRNMIPDY